MTCVSRCGITGGRPSTELTSTRTTCTAMLTASAIQVQVRPPVRRRGLRGACERSTAHLLHDTAEPMDGFGQPNGTFGAATFGQITSAEDGRVIQLGLKYIF